MSPTGTGRGGSRKEVRDIPRVKKRDTRDVVPSCSSSQDELLGPISSLAITGDDPPSDSGLPPLNDDEKAVMEVLEKKILTDLIDPLKVAFWCRREAIQESSDEDPATLTPNSPMEWENEEHAPIPAEAIAGPSTPTGVQSPEMTIEEKATFYKTVSDQMNDQEATAVMQFFEQNKSDISPALTELHACYSAFKERFGASSESPEMTTGDKTAFYKAVCDQMNDQEAVTVMQFFEQYKSDILPEFTELQMCYGALKERFNMSSE